MKGWQLGGIVVAMIGLLAVFTYVFQPDNTGNTIMPVRENKEHRFEPVPTPTPSGEQKKQIVGNASSFTGHDAEGKISWTLKATSIQMRDAEHKAEAKNIECTFYSKVGQPVAVVTARGAIVNLSNNNLQFLGRVTAVDPAGQTLTVEHLRYDGKLKRFLGHGGVRMTRATSVLIGDKVWADPNMKVVEVNGHVQAYVRTLAIGTPAPVAPPTVPPPPPDPDTPSPSGTAAPAHAGSGAGPAGEMFQAAR